MSSYSMSTRPSPIAPARAVQGAAAGRDLTHTQLILGPPVSSAKLTLEGLRHWHVRLEHELRVLDEDIEASERVAERWCGKTRPDSGALGDGLNELLALRDKKATDLAAVSEACQHILRDVDCAGVVASAIPQGSVLLLPRKPGQPFAKGPAVPAPQPAVPLTRDAGRTASVYASVGTSELINPASSTASARAVARRSPILLNSDVTRRLLF